MHTQHFYRKVFSNCEPHKDNNAQDLGNRRMNNANLTMAQVIFAAACCAADFTGEQLCCQTGVTALARAV